MTDVGAATWGSGATGIRGVISADNSLVGSSEFDRVSGRDVGTSQGITSLANGNYVVYSFLWDNGAAADAGAATWGSGTSGIQGVVSAANSLVGSTTGDRVGSTPVLALSNGNYVVSSPSWNNAGTPNAGAATWGNGTTGVTGAVSAANSLVGSSENDAVGSQNDAVDGARVTALSNGNYVVSVPLWDNGATPDVGAATWGNGATGVTGVISVSNSLIGGGANDNIATEVTALPNGNYVVSSPAWDNDTALNAGAATWGDGGSGITGVVGVSNSLVGTSTDDEVSASRFGNRGITVLTNGNYVVSSSSWDHGETLSVGAATWGSGTAGVKGTISNANSLIGSTADDAVGTSVSALSNGNYVVRSGQWHNGLAASAGAATWGSGTVGVKGFVSATNSLVGSTAGDQVGAAGVTAITNGNYVVRSPSWDNGPTADVGAATWGSGTTGVKGVVSAANSLIGGTFEDRVGFDGITALANGNYVVGSSYFDDGAATEAGAATWGSGTTGIKGVVSAANSLIGSVASDSVGSRVTPLASGNYVVSSQYWDSGRYVNAGAATFGSGATGITGAINGLNSALGAAEHSIMAPVVIDDLNGTFYVRFSGLFSATGGVAIRVGSQYNGFLPTPNITNFGGNLSYTENAEPILISTTTTVTDVDSDNFQNGKLRVSFSAGGGPDDRLAIRTVGTGSDQINVQGSQVRLGTIVLGTFTGGNGTTPLVVTLTSAATPDRVQTLLRNITYRNVSENPATAQRTVQVTVGDGQNPSAPVSKKISVVRVNDKPVLTLSGSLGYVRNAPAVVLAANATVTDVDSANFAGGVLRVRIAQGGGNNNTLAIGSGFTIDASGNVKQGDTIIGKRLSNGIGTNELKIQFNINATKSIARALVRAITYRNVGGTAGQRTIEFTISDGDGGLSNVQTKTVEVT